MLITTQTFKKLKDLNNLLLIKEFYIMVILDIWLIDTDIVNIIIKA